MSMVGRNVVVAILIVKLDHVYQLLIYDDEAHAAATRLHVLEQKLLWVGA